MLSLSAEKHSPRSSSNLPSPFLPLLLARVYLSLLGRWRHNFLAAVKEVWKTVGLLWRMSLMVKACSFPPDPGRLWPIASKMSNSSYFDSIEPRCLGGGLSWASWEESSREKEACLEAWEVQLLSPIFDWFIQWTFIKEFLCTRLHPRSWYARRTRSLHTRRPPLGGRDRKWIMKPINDVISDHTI